MKIKLYLSSLIFYCFIFNVYSQTNIFPTDGNVGIGTTSPNAKLEVFGNVKTNGGIFDYSSICSTCSSLIPTGTFGSTTNYGLQIRARTGNSFDFGFFAPNGDTYLLARTGSNSILFTGNIVLSTTKRLYFDGESNTYLSEISGDNINVVTGGTEKMRITNTGNIGIGTTQPESMLSVKGKVESQEVQVKANVADYVFEEGYTRLSLEELEAYIKDNGYLPRIQNQEDVDNNRGLVKLGELSISLMEKVEELTLHLIDLNKKISKLEQDNILIKDEISTRKE